MFEITELEREYIKHLVESNKDVTSYRVALPSLTKKISKIDESNYIKLNEPYTLPVTMGIDSCRDKIDENKLLKLSNGKLSRVYRITYSGDFSVDSFFCDWVLSLNKNNNENTEFNCDNDSSGEPDDFPFELNINITSLVNNVQHWLEHNLEKMSNVEKSNAFKKLTVDDKILYYNLIKTLEGNVKNITMLLNNE